MDEIVLRIAEYAKCAGRTSTFHSTPDQLGISAKPLSRLDKVMNHFSQETPLAPAVTDRQWNSIEKRDVLEYDAESETYRASFDGDARSVCTAVVSTVAAVSRTRPTELPPLHSVVDTDALTALVESTVTGPSGSDIHVSFTFDGYPVTVHSYGLVTVHPLPADSTD